jgi:DNA-3-methyladenine glycosylase
MKLPKSFYQREDTVTIARELLGKCLITNINGVKTGGVIVETEAYSWIERGCHAYNGRKTERNQVMFQPGGYAYVFLCYGIHHLFNVVTNKQGKADAVLIRAIEPTLGIDMMEKRRGLVKNPYQLTSGPGRLSTALGIDRSFNGKFLLNGDVWIESDGVNPEEELITSGARIGIDYAGKDAALPWRFTIRGNKWVSKK